MNELNEIVNKEVESIKNSLVRIKQATKTVPRYKKDKSRECTIELYGGSLDINYNFTAGRPAQMYEANGDPGYPEDPPEVEILSIKCDDLCMVLDYMYQPEKASNLIGNFYEEVEEMILKYESEYNNY